MKYLALVFFFGISVLSVFSQITITMPARLQVYAVKLDGTQVMMTTESLSIGYEQLQMTGELRLNTLNTDDENLRNLLDSAMFDKITFSGEIPEGQFVFQDVMDSRFTVETNLLFGDRQCRIIFDFNISNRNTSLANTFDITCTGTIYLADDLGITRNTGLDDKIGFQFFQNVQKKNY